MFKKLQILSTITFLIFSFESFALQNIKKEVEFILNDGNHEAKDEYEGHDEEQERKAAAQIKILKARLAKEKQQHEFDALLEAAYLAQVQEDNEEARLKQMTQFKLKRQEILSKLTKKQKKYFFIAEKNKISAAKMKGHKILRQRKLKENQKKITSPSILEKNIMSSQSSTQSLKKRITPKKKRPIWKTWANKAKKKFLQIQKLLKSKFASFF